MFGAARAMLSQVSHQDVDNANTDWLLHYEWHSTYGRDMVTSGLLTDFLILVKLQCGTYMGHGTKSQRLVSELLQMAAPLDLTGHRVVIEALVESYTYTGWPSLSAMAALIHVNAYHVHTSTLPHKEWWHNYKLYFLVQAVGEPGSFVEALKRLISTYVIHHARQHETAMLSSL